MAARRFGFAARFWTAVVLEVRTEERREGLERREERPEVEAFWRVCSGAWAGDGEYGVDGE